MQSIVYAAVGNTATASILVEAFFAEGNFNLIVPQLLRKAQENSSMSYSYEDTCDLRRYTFHTLCEGGLMYLCLSQAAFSSSVAYGFLSDVRDRFIKKYGEEAKLAIAFAAKEFAPELAQRVQFFNSPEADRLKTARTNLEATRQIMVKNLDTILSRGEKIEVLIQKTSLMMEEAREMHRGGTRVKRHFWWQNFRLSLLLFAVLLVIVFIVVWGLCGMPDFSDC